MGMLILGLALFLGVHSTRLFAEGWRAAMIRRLGEGRWKGLYALASLAGLALLVWGFGLARQQQVLLWSPPFFMRHVAWLLTLIAFILLAAAYVPRNAIKARLHHPMVLGVMVWALAHLLANGHLAQGCCLAASGCGRRSAFAPHGRATTWRVRCTARAALPARRSPCWWASWRGPSLPSGGMKL